jgi:hypothetical protein
MASSSSIPESSLQEVVPKSSTQETSAYEIRRRTMSLEEWELNVQTENLVDFISLAYHRCELRRYYEAQGLMDYFNMLNGPTYKNLVRHFWVRAQVYDRKAAQAEMDEKVLIDPTLAGKSRKEIGLEPFIVTEIRSSIMGIPVFVSQEVIAYVIRRPSGRSFKDGLDNNKNSPWNEVVNRSMFNSKKKCAYCDLTMEKKLLLKIQNENLLPKGGDQPSLEHRVFLDYFITKESANLPKYIFKHMIKELRESQDNRRCWIPYGRLISEILHQGGILKVLNELNIFTDDQLGTETGKVINGQTLRKMKLIEKGAFKKLSTDLKESNVVSDLMDGFPPICKQDPIEVRMNYIMDHFESTGETIRLCDIPDTIYGGALPVAKSKSTKRKALTQAEYLDDATEQPAKKAKKAKKEKAAVQENIVGPAIPTIQEEVEDLEADKILTKRTRNGKTAESSQPLPNQPSIPKKKRKTAVRKMKESIYVEEED